MLKTYSIFSENFLNAVQTAYTVHADLNRPAQNRRQQLRAWWPMKHVGYQHRFRNWNTILARPDTMHITINQSTIKPATIVRDLGVLFDGELSMR